MEEGRFTDAERKSIERAKEFLISKGICGRDGSGNHDVEALFVRVWDLQWRLRDIYNAVEGKHTDLTYVTIRELCGGEQGERE